MGTEHQPHYEGTEHQPHRLLALNRGGLRGLSAVQLLKFHLDCSETLFDRQFVYEQWRALYKADPLREELRKVFGAETTLMADNLKTLLDSSY